MTIPSIPLDFIENPPFEVKPYRTDGDFSFFGLLHLIALVIPGAILAGWLMGVIAERYYPIVALPVIIGGIIGFLGVIGVKYGKVNSPAVGYLVCTLGGICATITSHYYAYRCFLFALRDQWPGALDLLYSWDRFLRVTDLRAASGVPIYGFGIGETMINLGYYESYTFWFFECGIMVWVAAFVTGRTANAPFCSNCQLWKIPRDLGRFRVSDSRVDDNIKSGIIVRITNKTMRFSSARLYLSVMICPGCGGEGMVDITFAELSDDQNGNERMKKITCVTYPGEAYRMLVRQENLEFEKEPGPTH